MKIKPDNPIKNIIPVSDDKSSLSNKVDKKDNKGFEKFLEEAKAAGQGFEVGGTKHTEVVQHILKNVQPTGLQLLRKNAVHTLEKLFATMDMYKNALNNDRIDFSRMHTIIADMNKEKDEMLSAMLELPEGDNLRDIMTGAAVLVLNETNKYYRNYMY